jgi:hypothetical protein
MGVEEPAAAELADGEAPLVGRDQYPELGIFLCMLAYYVRWHLERAWAPLLFRDEDKPWSDDPVAPAQGSPQAERKAQTQRLPDGSPAHSFKTLLNELATLTKNRLRLEGGDASFEKVTEPTPLQQRALALLGLQPGP